MGAGEPKRELRPPDIGCGKVKALSPAMGDRKSRKGSGKSDFFSQNRHKDFYAFFNNRRKSKKKKKKRSKRKKIKISRVWAKGKGEDEGERDWAGCG